MKGLAMSKKTKLFVSAGFVMGSLSACADFESAESKVTGKIVSGYPVVVKERVANERYGSSGRFPQYASGFRLQMLVETCIDGVEPLVGPEIRPVEECSANWITVGIQTYESQEIGVIYDNSNDGTANETQGKFLKFIDSSTGGPLYNFRLLVEQCIGVGEGTEPTQCAVNYIETTPELYFETKVGDTIDLGVTRGVEVS
jgi:hypothetical protein